MASKAAGQIGVTFTRDDLHVLEALNSISEKTGAPVSLVVRQALKAALMDDPDALKMLETYRGFSAAQLLARAVRSAA